MWDMNPTVRAILVKLILYAKGFKLGFSNNKFVILLICASYQVLQDDSFFPCGP
jgi:hypothetical protein